MDKCFYGCLLMLFYGVYQSDVLFAIRRNPELRKTGDSKLKIHELGSR